MDLQLSSNLDLQPSSNLDLQHGSNIKNMMEEKKGTSLFFLALIFVGILLKIVMPFYGGSTKTHSFVSINKLLKLIFLLIF